MYEPHKIYTETNLSADPPELLDNHFDAFVKCNDNFDAIAEEFGSIDVEIYPDQLALIFSPEHYTPDIAASATAVDQLASHLKGIDDALDEATITYGTTADTACEGNDFRLSDARTAVSHTHPESDISDLGNYALSNHDHDSDYAAIIHASGHLSGQSDEVDGDKLDIDFSPSNYTPGTVENVTESTAHLTSHLNGIDTAIGGYATAEGIARLENTIFELAWNVLAEDGSFDDLHIDDLSDVTGIDTANSTGVYNASSGNYEAVAATTGATADYTSAQLDTTHWSDINAVSISQATPGDATASAIYHAISFDGGTTYKVYKSTAWTTVAYLNAGTWQYNNAGSLTNASTNSLAGAIAQSTAQAAYQWTKADIEAMTDANWEETGGWSTSVNTVDWTHRLVNGSSWEADGTQNSSITIATPDMTAATSPSGEASASHVSTDAWKLFNRDTSATWNATAGGPGFPQWVVYDFGSGAAKAINKLRMYGYSTYSPKRWVLEGSDDGSNWTEVCTTYKDADMPDPGSGYTSWIGFTNATAYRYYRLYITAGRSTVGTAFYELELVECETETTTPTFTKTTFNHDTEYVALDLRTSGWEASANDPSDGYVVLDVEPIDSITNNTDIKAYISINDGSNYEEVTLDASPFKTLGSHQYVRGDIIDITARTDKTVRFRVTSHNLKALKVHGIGGGVKYS